jgi:hypothetical protein
MAEIDAPDQFHAGQEVEVSNFSNSPWERAKISNHRPILGANGLYRYCVIFPNHKRHYLGTNNIRPANQEAV